MKKLLTVIALCGRSVMLGILWSRALALCGVLFVTVSWNLAGQGGPSTGGRDLVRLDFAATPLGEFPSTITMLTGAMDVVDKDGQHMLRASSRSAFLIRLPEQLPRDFTIEVDFIPKATGYPEDLALEGTREINQGESSANILWHPARIGVVGGARDNYEAPMPEVITMATVGQLTKLVMAVEDETIKLYTNGRLTTMLPNRKFARARVLRVHMGGEGDGDHAVHLAALRITTTAPPTATSTQAMTGPGGQPAGGSGLTGPPGTPPPNPSSTGASRGAPVPNAIANLAVTQGASGPIVDWLGVPSAVYTVQRWLLADPQCCSNTSPASPPLTAPPWQDAPPPIAGTYVYRVTATTSSGSTSAQTQFDYVAPGGGQVTAPSGAPPGGIRSPTAPTSTSPTLSAPTGATATPSAALTVTVTMGNQGPIVTWPLVPNASGYAVGRWKIDDANCCNNSSGRAYGASSPWQDQPLPVSGTYVYRVAALTPLGEVYGETQFGFRLPGSPTQPTLTAVPATSPGGTITPAAAPAPSTGASNVGQYRVVLTGIRVSDVTLEMPVGPDGRGDEVYAAAAVVVWDRGTKTVRNRSSVITKEYGELANASLFPNRLQGGTITPNGGIWTGNGIEQVPGQFDPAGSSIPAPTTDRFPILVWEGTLTDGVDAILVAPSVWERDVDATVYRIWSNNWRNAPLDQLFNTALTIQLTSTQLTAVPMNTPGAPIVLPIGEITGNVKDHPIGVVPKPVNLPPITADYQDRYVMITREKLGALTQPGAAMTLPITFTEPTTLVSRGSYTLFLRIERLP